ncbi:hypothetical protein HK101_003798 [Irineochytrium annulatum]|nr:hypothetical protein HK101_003798 [Irineochytrium annulatum]
MIASQSPSNPACLPIAGAKYCQQWSAFSVVNMTDLAAFEANVAFHIDSTADSQAQFQADFACPGWAGIGLRYTETVYCAYLVGVASHSGCNEPTTAPTVCRSVAQAYVDSLSSVFANATLCTPGAATTYRTETVGYFTSFASDLKIDVGSSAANGQQCIVSSTDVPAEAQACGFYSAAAGAAYCAGVSTTTPASAIDVQCCGALGVTLMGGATTTSSLAPAAFLPTSSSSSAAPAATTAARVTSAAPAPAPTTATSNAVAADSTTGGTSSSSTIFGIGLPIFIGATVGGAAVIIAVIVGVILCVKSKRGARQGDMDNNGPQKGYGNSAVAPEPNYSQHSQSEKYAEAEMGYGNGARVDEWNQQSQQQNMGPPMGGQQQQFYDEFGGPGGEHMEMGMMQSGQNGMGMGMDQGMGGGMGNQGMGGMGPGAAMGAGAGAGVGAGLMMMGGDMGGAREAPTPTGPEETMEAVFNYVPNLSDEIYLYVGDPVVVKCKFDDGWGYGYNMTTKQEGSFPLACVSPYSAEQRQSMMPKPEEPVPVEPEYVDESNYDPSRASFTIRQRQSSMFGPPPGFRATMMTEAA